MAALQLSAPSTTLIFCPIIVPPESGPERFPVLALFMADVSHTANSNTQLMLLYETNERTNERKI